MGEGLGSFIDKEIVGRHRCRYLGLLVVHIRQIETLCLSSRIARSALSHAYGGRSTLDRGLPAYSPRSGRNATISPHTYSAGIRGC